MVGKKMGKAYFPIFFTYLPPRSQKKSEQLKLHVYTQEYIASTSLDLGNHGMTLVVLVRVEIHTARFAYSSM